MIIRCYLYNTQKLNKMLQSIFMFLKKNNIKDISVKKSYLYGYHIAIKIHNSNQELISFVEKNYINYTDKNIDYIKIAKLINATSQMEETIQNCLPLKEDGTITFSSEDELLLPKKNIFDDKLVDRIEHLQTKYLIDIYSLWIKMSEDEQNYQIANLFFFLADLNPKGIKFGYLGARSNYEYFKEQLKDYNNPRVNQWKFYITNRNNCDKNFIKNGVEKYKLKKICNYKNDQKFIYDLLELFRWGIKENLVKTDNLYTAKTFFQRHSHSSEFHKLYYKDQEFIDQYESNGFILYRLLLSSIYSILPEFNISSLRKQKITGLVSESVEKYFNINYKDVYYEWKNKELLDS